MRSVALNLVNKLEFRQKKTIKISTELFRHTVA